ncbi:MAG TPA: glycyl-radical enzyme activating protein, partial [Myxococcota bacterium]|nr:glycyl-radical enzyme activating protein [Myxococcota bacterium]
ERCLPGCALCVPICPEQALRVDRAERVVFARCTSCGACLDVCPTAALRQIGRRVGVEALLAELLRDCPFYEASGGGVTFSGGEPVLHSAFLAELLPRLRRERLHVALETSGHYPFTLLEPLLPCVDLVLYDLKVMDPAAHERLTGHGNAQIHANLRRLLASGAAVEVRMPVVPDRNTSEANVAATARLLAELGVRSLTLLPYNHLWEAKLPRLGTARQPLGIRPPDPAFYAALQRAFAEHGLAAQL